MGIHKCNLIIASGHCSSRDLHRFELCFIQYKEHYSCPFKLTVIFKFNQSHPEKSSKTLVIASTTLQIFKAYNLTIAASQAVAFFTK